MFIRDIEKSDIPRVIEIFAEGIDTCIATFRPAPPTPDEWDDAHLPDARLCSVENGVVNGWAALTPYPRSCAYRGVAELSLYVAADSRGRGVGSALLRELIARSEQCGIRTLESRVIAENSASLRLHARCGFRVSAGASLLPKRATGSGTTRLF